MNARELAMSPSQLIAEQERQRAAAKARASRVRPKRAGSVAKKKATREEGEAFYERAKREAAARATDPNSTIPGPKCEHIDGPFRCDLAAVDPDHVIGGAYRKDSERLGAEGLMWLCRYHHDLKHASSPSRTYWLDVAEAHALRHGYRRLLSLVARARAKYEAKHPEARNDR